MDVQVLLEGVESFLGSLRDKHPEFHDPLASITLPSLINRIFRDKFMCEESIPLLPPDGFVQHCSVEELCWLAWMKMKLKLTKLFTNRNCRGFKIGNFSVDGVGWDENGVMHVLEFDGCYWHGCDCRPLPSNIRAREEHQSRSLRSQAKFNRLSMLSTMENTPYGPFMFHCIRECEFYHQKLQNNDMADFVDKFQCSLDINDKGAVGSLSLRESFCGGRTEVFSHREVDSNIMDN